LPEGIAEEGEDDGWAVGGQLSVVDFNLYLFYRWGKEMMGMKMEELYPRWTELVRRLEKRPSVKTAVWVENVRAVF
jgi:glutathione S-transferase